MIVWGSKGEVADLGSPELRHCATCEKERTFRLMLQYKVHHIWYLFKWVSGKQYARVCEVCHRGDKLPAKEVEATLTRSPIPFMSRYGWTFLVGLIACLVTFGAIDGAKRSDRTQAYLAEPHKNDVYVVNVSSLLKAPESKLMYGLLRVRGAQGDKVEFDAPAVTYNKVTGATKDLHNGKLGDPDYFIKDTLVLTRDELGRMQKDGAIHSIERD